MCFIGPRTSWSLAHLVQAVLGSSMEKVQSVRCGNWEAKPLSDVQQRYAALDAYAGLAVLLRLQSLPLKPPPLPPVVRQGDAIGAEEVASDAAAAVAAVAEAPTTTAMADAMTTTATVETVVATAGAVCDRTVVKST